MCSPVLEGEVILQNLLKYNVISFGQRTQLVIRGHYPKKMQYVLSLKLLLICFSGSTKDWNGLSITSRNGDDISDEKKSPFLNLKKKIRRTYTLHLKDFFDILTKKKRKNPSTRKNSFRPGIISVCSYNINMNTIKPTPKLYMFEK